MGISPFFTITIIVVVVGEEDIDLLIIFAAISNQHKFFYNKCARGKASDVMHSSSTSTKPSLKSELLSCLLPCFQWLKQLSLKRLLLILYRIRSRYINSLKKSYHIINQSFNSIITKLRSAFGAIIRIILWANIISKSFNTSYEIESLLNFYFIFSSLNYLMFIYKISIFFIEIIS